jgi:hypothetical protein
MGNKLKKLLLLGAGGLGVWYILSHHKATQQVNALPVIVPPTVPGSGGTVVVAPIPPSQVTVSQAPDPTQLQALLTWSNLTKNPPLYQQMINQLNAQDINSLYGLLVGYWTTGTGYTLTQLNFWNGLVQRYPMLETAGAGCNNLQCT